ncbi:hypothetical protein GGR31_001365 [Mesonia maritima]|uniref:Uncharacterized protein n=1 Tax=Mesonia maritima TaxID=1793873 RepID=A0ABU1K8B3_9FLAO|nr:hypothetical protein [Mesonia maritima]
MKEKPEKYYWKSAYTFMLVANLIYWIGFFIIMKFFA